MTDLRENVRGLKFKYSLSKDLVHTSNLFFEDFSYTSSYVSVSYGVSTNDRPQKLKNVDKRRIFEVDLVFHEKVTFWSLSKFTKGLRPKPCSKL